MLNRLLFRVQVLQGVFSFVVLAIQLKMTEIRN